MLTEFDTVLLGEMRNFLSTISGFKFDENNSHLSLVDDEATHFSRQSKQVDAKEKNKGVKFPMAVLFRESISEVPLKTLGSSAPKIRAVASVEVGSTVEVKLVPVEITYKVIVYTSGFEDTNKVTEHWLLNAGGQFTKLSYYSSEYPEFTIEELSKKENEINKLSSTFSMEMPEVVVQSRDSTETGLFYVQSFPLVGRVNIFSGPVTINVIDRIYRRSELRDIKLDKVDDFGKPLLEGGDLVIGEEDPRYDEVREANGN